MLIRPDREDFRIITHTLGRIFTVVAVASCVPLTWAALGREWHPFASFLLMIGLFAVLGQLGLRNPPKVERLDWSHGMVVVALTWLAVPAIGSIPFIFSGHYGSPLDAMFDAMSGLTTTGLALVQDLDHLAPSLNFWRHLLHFLGGQGIVIAALVLFAGGGGLTLYYGEARDERILPSVRRPPGSSGPWPLVHLVAGVFVLGVVAHQVLGFDWTAVLLPRLDDLLRRFRYGRICTAIDKSRLLPLGDLRTRRSGDDGRREPCRSASTSRCGAVHAVPSSRTSRPGRSWRRSLGRWS